MTHEPCTTDPSHGFAIARGLCQRCYDRWRRTGDPLGGAAARRNDAAAAEAADRAARMTAQQERVDRQLAMSDDERAALHDAERRAAWDGRHEPPTPAEISYGGTPVLMRRAQGLAGSTLERFAREDGLPEALIEALKDAYVVRARGAGPHRQGDIHSATVALLEFRAS